jgi:predicted CXXCH cytochrome family protein
MTGERDNPLDRWRKAALAAALVIVLAVPLAHFKQSIRNKRLEAREPPESTYVGREKCVKCHEKENKAWLGSDHDRAMDPATPDTVLGNFDNATFVFKGVTSRFYTRDGRYFVETEGPDGRTSEFPVTYVFGFDPLQQYLVPFPGGRLQCLHIAWDVERKTWFHLYPDQPPPPRDWLHWTRNGQNWNGMCAECHSTDLKKNYDPKSDSYHTTWSEIDVSCEACHGPGSRHAAWGELPAMGRPEIADAGLLVHTRGLAARPQVELCAPCHSRRTILGEYEHAGQGYFDNFRPALLAEGVYYPDGQILGEDYVYGSYVQSKMFRSGVRCSDCHDVHSLKLVKEGNDLCLQCHQADVYNSKDHHFHKERHKGKPSPGWLCINCHMPQRPYMVIDWRADHSIRVPRPDLHLAIGTPDACSSAACHGDKPVRWSADWYTKWYGISRKPHFGTILAGGRKRDPAALKNLVWLAGNPLYPSIVRSTAIDLLRNYGNEAAMAAMKRALADDEPLVRHTAVMNGDLFPPDERLPLLGPLLWDPNRIVRMEAARNLAAIPGGQFKPDQAKAFKSALAEYERAMAYSLDFAFAGVNLGNLYAARGDREQAKRYYRQALAVDDLYYPAKVNLATLLSQEGKNAEAEKLLREVLETYPELHEVAYSLGLLYAEMNRPEEALRYLGRAAAGIPEGARVHYNYGLMLQQAGRLDDAQRELSRAWELDPSNADLVYALLDHYLKRGQVGRARDLANTVIARYPETPIGRELRRKMTAGQESAFGNGTR